MDRVVLGNTGIKAYKLGFGGIPIQRVEEETAVAVIAHALERGVDFVDTSRGYTTSERRIGLALKRTRKQVTIASKSKSRTAEGMRSDLEKSLEELGREYIDLYQCHNIRTLADYEQVMSPGGAMEAMRKAKEEGLIRHIGVTSHSLDTLERILDDGIFETIMVCFSFLEHKAREKVIPKAIGKKVGVIAMKPFSGGVIEETQLALKYALSEPGILVIAGVEEKELFDKNWETFQENHKLTFEEMRDIKQIQRRFEKNFCRRCDYCQPCPEGIRIQYLMGLRSLVKRRGIDVLQAGWVREAVDKARECTQCKMCMSRCPYELPIPDMIRENLRWADERLLEI